MPKRDLYFSNALKAWYLENKRDLPWRQTKDPYRVWLSEIILQQTRVAQGMPYYLAFIDAFPRVQDLAAAPEEKVLKLWQGLGYYSRARNLHAAAKMVVTQYQGEFPTTYKELLQLKGVGDYTASAIGSFCFDRATAVVDGNVYRVLSRMFGIDIPINTGEGNKVFKAMAQALIDPEDPATFNQAIMEFGALQCRPKNPDCDHCVFHAKCEALAKDTVAQLPVKVKKTKVKKRFLHYFFVRSLDDKTLLQQRQGKGIWQGLYEFPLIETPAAIDLSGGEADRFRESVLRHPHFASLAILDMSPYNETPLVHKLSHQHLHTIFWSVEVAELGPDAIAISDLRNFAVPVLIANFIDSFVKKQD